MKKYGKILKFFAFRPITKAVKYYALGKNHHLFIVHSLASGGGNTTLNGAGRARMRGRNNNTNPGRENAHGIMKKAVL